MTTLSMQPCANATRAAPASLRWCARRELRLQRRPLRAAADVAAGGISRGVRTARARIALQRVRPSPPLRGFMPLYRH
ncbi:MAG: hypothetical protein ABI190_00620 [Casimicrobiaceae bacterium]